MAAHPRVTSARRLSLGVALTWLAALVTAAPAFGHASFVGSQPGPGARLETSPQRVVLTFTEPLNERLSRATLVAVDDGKVVARGQASTERRLVLRLASPLDTGAYRVEWHTVSTEDGHALEGSFSFGVRATAAGGDHTLEQSPLARAGWVRVGLRALLYVATLLFAAGLLLALLLRSSWPVPHGAGVDEAGIRDRERSLVRDLGWLAVAAAVGATLAEAADAAGGISLAGLRDFLLSNSSGAARVLMVLGLLAAAVFAQRRRAWPAVFTTLALWGVAASGHASSATPRIPSIANDWLHLLSGAVWLGGIGLIALVWASALRRGGRRAREVLVRHVLPAFGRVALPAFLLVTATGLVSLVTQMGRLETLWTTGYGRVLLVKIALVGLVATSSAAHAWLLRPRLLRDQPSRVIERRHWRLVRSEPLIGLGVALAVGLLVAFPLPPRQLVEAGEASAAAAVCDPCPLPEPTADELPVAGQAGSRIVAAWLRREQEQLTGTVRVLDGKGRRSRAQFEVLGAAGRSCGRGCRRFTAPLRDDLQIAVREHGRRYVATLPANWDGSANRRARRLLERTQSTMRSLRTVQQSEEVTSGPGSYARTDYVLQAPDRMAFVTNGGARTVIVGERRWFRSGDEPWTVTSHGSGLPFSVRRWFRWTTYARVVRLLDRRREDGRPVTELALMDPATPVWLRLVIDDETRRVLRERLVTKAHFITTRYRDFDEPLRVRVPDVG